MTPTDCLPPEVAAACERLQEDSYSYTALGFSKLHDYKTLGMHFLSLWPRMAATVEALRFMVKNCGCDPAFNGCLQCGPARRTLAEWEASQ